MGEQLTVDDSVPEWEAGLPSLDDLTPLSQPLIPALLASAFKITPDPPRTVEDINRASENTLSSIGIGMSFVTESNFKNFGNDHGVEEGNDEGLELNKCGRSEQGDDFLIDNGGDDQSTGMAKTLKRPRLVWTPQLHKRFVDVVAHLGLKNAVPKTIMQLMNVEGLTRENVASHLQKYRLYVKRMEGLSNEGPSPSDHLFASTPVPPQSFIESSSGGPSHGNGISNGSHSSVGNGTSANSHVVIPMPMPYPPPQSIMPMQMMGMTGHGHGCIRYDVAQAQHNEHYQQQVMNMEQHQRNWQANLPNGYPQGLSHNNSKC